MQILRFAHDDNGGIVMNVLRALCVSAVKPPHPVYIPITRSIALLHTAQNVLCRVNMMQSTSER
jgi:hypothetical protein